MNVQGNAVVSFHYQLSDESGEQLEDSSAGNPVLYLHGRQGMLPGLEEALEGKSAGDAFTVVVPPEKGYGERTEGAQERIPKKRVLTQGKLVPGMTIQVNTDSGVREVVVLKAGLKSVDVDSNHPFAGKTLTFSIEVVDVREATRDEISHGHAHGVGGHQH